eukprot:2450444-Amphidinium_carterae.1
MHAKVCTFDALHASCAGEPTKKWSHWCETGQVAKSETRAVLIWPVQAPAMMSPRTSSHTAGSCNDSPPQCHSQEVLTVSGKVPLHAIAA